jgi:hypothetical protein
VTKFLRLKKLKRKKSLFWLMVSEVSVYDWPSGFGAYGKTQHHGSRSMWWKTSWQPGNKE